MQVPASVAQLAQSQSGVVSHAQLKSAGVTKSALGHLVRSGRWQRILPRVYVTHSGPVGRAAKIWAAVLYAGDGAVVSHSTAAGLHGWQADDDLIHVIVPACRSVAEQPDIVVHRSTLSTRDCRVRDGLLVTSPLRTALDLLSSARTGERALNLVARAVQRRQVDAAQLAERLSAGKFRWKATVLPALDDIARGSHSGLELRFAQTLRRHGLPLGQRQAAHGPTRVDMAYPRLIIELDGRLGHDTAADAFRDMHRDNAHALDGRTVLRFGWHDVQTRACAVARVVAAALRVGIARCGDACQL
jgi:very-short-patch-repair endonuclease